MSYSPSHPEAVVTVDGSQNPECVALRCPDAFMNPWLRKTSATPSSGLLELQDRGATAVPMKMGIECFSLSLKESTYWHLFPLEWVSEEFHQIVVVILLLL